MLFELLDPLCALSEGNITAGSVPEVLPMFIDAFGRVPETLQSKVMEKLIVEAEKAVAELRAEGAKESVQEVEVHTNVVCDGCGMGPIVGDRYMSLEKDDFDLCKTCYCSEHREVSGWARVNSEVTGSVVGSYFGTDDALPLTHHGVICDDCEMHPIVGKRFQCLEDDTDLCQDCWARSLLMPQEVPRRYRETLHLLYCIVGPATSTIEEAKEGIQHAASQSGEGQRQVAGDEQDQKLQHEEEKTADAAEEKDENNEQAAQQQHQQQQQQQQQQQPQQQQQQQQQELQDKHEEFELKQEDPQELEGCPCLQEDSDQQRLEHGSQHSAMVSSADTETLKAAVAALLQHPSADIREAAEAAVLAAQMRSSEKSSSDSKSVEAAEEQHPEHSSTDRNAKVAPPTSAEVQATAKVIRSELTLGVEAFAVPGSNRETSGELVAGAQARQAFCLGHVVVPVGEASVEVPVQATVVLFNDGLVPWPETTVLVLAMGDDLDLPRLQLGTVLPGEHAEVHLDLSLPSRQTPQVAQSAWALVNEASGSWLGPLLFIDTEWAA